MPDVAALGLGIDSRPAREAVTALGELTAAAGGAEASVGKLLASADRVNAALGTSASGARTAATAQRELSTAVQTTGVNLDQFIGKAGGAARAANDTTAALARQAAGWRALSEAGRDAVQQYERNAQAMARMGSLSSTGAVPQRPAAPAPGPEGPRELSPEYRRQLMMNLAFQGKDFFEQVLAGSSPVRAGLMQGPQALSIMQMGGFGIRDVLSAATEKVTGFVSRIGLAGGVIGGFTLAITAAAAAAWSYRASQDALRLQLSGAGRASGATLQGINDLAAANAGAAGFSQSEYREMAGTFAATGRIGQAMYADLIKSAKDYAYTTSQDVPDAIKDLAQAFADPAKGAEALQEKLGGLNDRTLESVRRLQEQGDRLGAQRELFNAYAMQLEKVSERTSLWAQATTWAGNLISDVWDKVGGAINKAVTGGTLEQQLATAKELLATAEASRGGIVAGLIGGSDETIDKLTKLVQAIQQQIKTRDDRNAQATAAANSRQVMGIVRGLDPEAAQFDSLKSKVELLRKAIADPVQFGLDRNQLAEVASAFDRIAASVRATTYDIQRFGSEAGAAAYRASEHANKTVGLDSVTKQIADRQFQRDEELKPYADLPTRAELMKEFESRLNDPNLDARDRQLIQDEIDKRMKRITERETIVARADLDIERIQKTAEEAAKRSTSATTDLFIKAMIGAESGGDRFAKNQNSSASGIGQFIKGTWVPLFRQTFPDRAANMSDAAVWERRWDRDDQMALIKVYAEQNRRKLENAQLDTSLRNQYLMWFAGPKGGLDLLRADPNTPVSEILSPDAIASNRKILAGKTAGQVLNWADATINRKLPDAQAAERQIAVDKSRITTTEQTSEALARQDKIQELLNSRREAGTAIGLKFKTAQELLTANEKDLTDAERAERDTILSLADAHAKNVAAMQQSKIMQDALFERSQLGRTDSEQRIASRLRGTGLDMDSPEAEVMRVTDALGEAKAMAKDAFSGLASDLRRGVSAAEALKNVMDRIVDKLMNKAIDKLVSGLFDGIKVDGSGGISFGGFGGGGGIFSSLFGGGGGSAASSVITAADGTLWFAEGGYTGAGGKYDPAGIVHRGEYVFDAATVAKVGVGTLDALRGRLRGYADGGYVSPADYPVPAAPSPANSNQPANGPTFIAQITSQATGDPQADQRAAEANAKAMRAEYEKMWMAMAQREMRPGGTLHAAGARRAS
ncbi:phage tail length tape measure family protein [Methylobacterium nodulans]|nr:phage tail length tape measure family protein [Methylobacterium nodulans]